jgi:sulfatase modifying factor 1
LGRAALADAKESIVFPTRSALLMLGATASLASSAAFADISMQTLTVGDVGNAADTTGLGAVDYGYSIGKYEVTNTQYVAFLNAKAKSDPNNLYNGAYHATYGGITRSGTAGSYTYATISGRENWAVTYVSFWDACRFANWMSNGQGDGDTENGSYTLTPTGIANNTVTRNVGATWVIPTENEWYKAAFYKSGGLNAGFWSYGTGTNSITTSMANYNSVVSNVLAVGSFAPTSAYGAFDMAGNAWEKTEKIITGGKRQNLGGAFNSSIGSIQKLDAGFLTAATFEENTSGFRMAFVPGPSSIALLGLAGLAGRRRKA